MCAAYHEVYSLVRFSYRLVPWTPHAAKNDDGEVVVAISDACRLRKPRSPRDLFIPNAYLCGFFPPSSGRYSGVWATPYAGGGMRTHNIVTSSGATAVGYTEAC